KKVWKMWKVCKTGVFEAKHPPSLLNTATLSPPPLHHIHRFLRHNSKPKTVTLRLILPPPGFPGLALTTPFPAHPHAHPPRPGYSHVRRTKLTSSPSQYNPPPRPKQSP